MPWCPQCGEEYRPGFARCRTCDAELTAQPPADEPLPAAESVRETLLTVVPDEVAFAQVESLLGVAGIPVLKKHRGSGEYLELYMGASPYGIEVYVPHSALEAAKAILSGDWSPGGEAPEGEPPFTPAPVTVLEPEEDRELHRYLMAVNDDMQRRRKVIAVTILLSVAGGVLLSLVNVLSELFSL